MPRHLARRPLPHILACLSLGLPAAVAQDDPYELRGKHVSVRCDPASSEHARWALEEADPLAEHLEKDLGVSLDEPAAITICRSHEDFERTVGKPQGLWVRGLANLADNRIAIKQLPELTFRKVVRHEVAHLLLGQALGEYSSQAPRWLHEGAAKHYAQDWSTGDAAVLAEAERNNRLHTLEELTEFPTNPHESAVAYAQSAVLVEYLLSLDPEAGLSEFVAQLRKTGEVERAVRRTYGLPMAEVEAGWVALVRERARNTPRLWAVQGTIFLVMVLIFAVAYRRVRRRSREIRERMEQEELMERLVGDLSISDIRLHETPDEETQNPNGDNTPGTS